MYILVIRFVNPPLHEKRLVAVFDATHLDLVKFKQDIELRDSLFVQSIVNVFNGGSDTCTLLGEQIEVRMKLANFSSDEPEAGSLLLPGEVFLRTFSVWTTLTCTR